MSSVRTLHAQSIKAKPCIFTLKGRTLNFSCAVAPTYKSLFEVTKLQANFTSPPRSDHHCSSTDLGFYDILRQHHGKKNELHHINSQQSFEALPLKPNGQIKNMGAPDQKHPIQQSLGIDRRMNFAGGTFRNTTIQPVRWEEASERSSLGARETLGQSPL
jgi:hypothetical protein